MTQPDFYHNLSAPERIAHDPQTLCDLVGSALRPAIFEIDELPDTSEKITHATGAVLDDKTCGVYPVEITISYPNIFTRALDKLRGCTTRPQVQVKGLEDTTASA